MISLGCSYPMVGVVTWSKGLSGGLTIWQFDTESLGDISDLLGDLGNVKPNITLNQLLMLSFLSCSKWWCFEHTDGVPSTWQYWLFHVLCLNYYLRMVLDTMVNCRAMDIMHYCIFFMYTMIILVLDAYTTGCTWWLCWMITVVYASRAWVYVLHVVAL